MASTPIVHVNTCMTIYYSFADTERRSAEFQGSPLAKDLTIELRRMLGPYIFIYFYSSKNESNNSSNKITASISVSRDINIRNE